MDHFELNYLRFPGKRSSHLDLRAKFEAAKREMTSIKHRVYARGTMGTEKELDDFNAERDKAEAAISSCRGEQCEAVSQAEEKLGSVLKKWSKHTKAAAAAADEAEVAAAELQRRTHTVMRSHCGLDDSDCSDE